MRYWDASALVPLCVHEPASARLRSMAARSPLLTWCLSSVEIASAIERRTREGALSSGGRVTALANLTELSHAWTEITAIGPVRDRAARLLATHALRAADALQLAAALVVVADRPGGHEFLCSDRRLRNAARREGFAVPAIATRLP